MASLNEQTEYDVVYESPALSCPACGDRLSVIATVDVIGGSVRKVGEEGFKRAVFSINIESNIRCFTIQHQCQPRMKDNI